MKNKGHTLLLSSLLAITSCGKGLISTVEEASTNQSNSVGQLVNVSEQAYIKASNTSNSDNYGKSVAINGDTLVVGSYYEASNTTSIINGTDLSSTNDSGFRNGAVYVYKKSGATWSQEAYLKAPNTTNDDYFGEEVAVDGDTIVVGVPYEDSNTTSIIHGSDLSSTNDLGYRNGAVYVFKRTGVTWVLEAYLKAPNNSNSDFFGTSVDIDGDTIVVGSSYESSNTSTVINGSDLSSTNDLGGSNGAAYVYKRTGATWALEAYLKAPNTSGGDQFGDSVAIDGDTVIVGASREDSSTVSIINSSDLSSTNDSGSSNGAAYVFKRSGSTWSFESYLKAPNTSVDDYFGYSVDVSSDSIAVTARYEESSTTEIINGSDLSSTDNSCSECGAVYIYTRSGSTWNFESYLKSPNISSEDRFGYKISLQNDTLIASSRREDSTSTGIINGSDLSATNDLGGANGAVYVFKRSGSLWGFQSYIKPTVTTDYDNFGDSIGFDGTTIVVGAPHEDSNTNSIIYGSDLSSTNDSGNGNGAAYLFDVTNL